MSPGKADDGGRPPPPAQPTHDEAQLLVVAGVHGLALLHAAAVVGLALHVEGDPPQLEDDVPLSLPADTQLRVNNLLASDASASFPPSDAPEDTWPAAVLAAFWFFFFL